jgi:hypothetical protein
MARSGKKEPTLQHTEILAHICRTDAVTAINFKEFSSFADGETPMSDLAYPDVSLIYSRFKCEMADTGCSSSV